VLDTADAATAVVRPLSSRLPELDGLRALAVSAVLAFHLELDWAAGGYLGVSVFFTLSGFLLTALVFDEIDRSGRFGSRRFLRRRVDRLVPAASVTLLGTALLMAGGLTGPLSRGSVGDLAAAAAQVANWRFARSASYDELFRDPSPILHFWSLALEWQLYLALAGLAAGVAAAGRLLRPGCRPPGLVVRRVLIGLLLAALAGAVLVTTRTTDFDRWYYGTDTRAAEFLAGAVLAAVAYRRPVRCPRLLGMASLVALVALACLFVLVDLGRLRSQPGWLLLTAGLSTVLVLAAAVGEGPVARLLARPWMGRIGARSYPLYLVHWPLFVVVARFLDPGPARVAFQLGAAAAAAEALHRGIGHSWSLDRPRRVAAMAGATALALALPVMTWPDHRRADSLEQLREQVRQRAVAASLPPGAVEGTTSGTAPEPSTRRPGPSGVTAAAQRPARIAFVGDSQALVLAVGAANWGEASGRAQVAYFGDLGCAIARGGDVRYDGIVHPLGTSCAPWYDGFDEELAAFAPDVIVVLTGPFDLADRRLLEWDRWLTPTDPRFLAHFESEAREARVRLERSGVPVVWLLPPPLVSDDGSRPELAPARLEALTETLRRATAGLEVVDLRLFHASCPGGEADRVVRPDGVHTTPQSATVIARWLVPTVLADDPSEVAAAVCRSLFESPDS
jgi:peptidoglycan/LPS O-acetylase OafA/YrhL